MNNKPAAEAEAGSGSQAVDEAQLNEAMKRLKLLHIKSRLLRDTIPRMIEPLVQKQPSPDVMFTSFVKAVADAQTEVKDFTDLMRDEESKKAMAMADKSREENPFGIKPWRHKDHPDWFDMDKD
ncbi:hypothetical protein JDV02_003629 [Purpureocillium takamizusanense]|uniref:Uncharacterized protein n=1 Tax=Purpureocillium takamizusanense TaxID=2060973 RepID=A0A9Q8QEI6_9HYPO|nr:uncharacterized protein JDV02_003629 [Purpureocillium takamizusanense]UNI17272.1 hypothetical protein JDV02_003629 [Purpureocillium takamizusanense]